MLVLFILLHKIKYKHIVYNVYLKKTCETTLMTDHIKLKKSGDIEIEVDMVLVQEGEFHVAFIPSLNLTSHSKDQSTAEKNILDAVNLFFDVWTKKGKLNERLESLGWSQIDHHMAPFDIPSVPFHLLKEQFTLSKIPVRVPSYA